MKIDRLVAVGFVTLGLVVISGADNPKTEPTTRRVADIVKDHDRSLHRDLADYVRKNPKADDVEQAYLALFEKGHRARLVRRDRAARPAATSRPRPRGRSGLWR